MAHRFVEVSVSHAPLVRRDSLSERVISAMDEGEQELSYSIEKDSFTSLSSSFSFQSIRINVQQRVEEFADMAEEEMRVIEEAEEEARRKERRRAEVRGQKRHVHKNTKIILMDDIKFRQLKKPSSRQECLRPTA